jgi:hypothetical protein
MKSLKMDEIDSAQQRQIDSLQVWMKIVAAMMFLAMVLMTTITFMAIQKSDPYNCPHPDCVHHRANK